MKILTAAEMGVADRRTVEKAGVSMESLMEAAGHAVAAFCLRRYPKADRLIVLCGKGNNGGDGLVAARLLALAGRTVQVALLGAASDLKGEAAEALARLDAESVEVEFREIADEAALSSALGGEDLLIDAVVGTG